MKEMQTVIYVHLGRYTNIIVLIDRIILF